jgi:hypothetical protein
MQNFNDENVLQHAAEAFAETIGLKVRQLRRFIPKAKAETNTDITGAYIEEVVRGFLGSWIGHQKLVHGTFYSKVCEVSREPALQINGIVHDPTKGPLILSEGDFAIVHPAFCSGVVEIKTSISSAKSFEDRLQTVHQRYMSHLPTPHVMGIVIADSAPEKSSKLKTKDDRTLDYHNYFTAPLCPIFFLFKETEDGYEPFMPAIDAMIRAVHRLYVSTNYM